MGAIVGTVAKITEFAGTEKLAVITAPVAAASDTIDLSATFSTISGIVGAVITAGMDTAFSYIQVSFSGTTLTVVSLEQDGTAATDFTGTTISIGVLGSASAI